MSILDDANMILLGLLIMFSAGFVKGVIGLGLPLIVVGILSIFLPIKEVLGILILPLIVTNVWQMFEVGGAMKHLHRFWLLAAMMALGLGFGTRMLVTLDPAWLFLSVGLMVTIFTGLGFLQPSMRLPSQYEKPVGVLIGGLAGICGGLGGVWGPPISTYLLALNLKRDEFIGTVGMLWFLGALPLGVFYFANGIIGMHNVWYSMAGCFPAIIGYQIGKRIRSRIPQETFKKILMGTLFIIGLYLISRALN